MKLTKKSALVTTIGGKMRVVEASDLQSLASTPGLTIGRVTPARSTGKLPRKPLADNFATETMLKSQDASFGISRASEGYAFVITRQEDIAFGIGEPAGYYKCGGPRGHTFMSHEAPADLICDRGDRAPLVWVYP